MEKHILPEDFYTVRSFRKEAESYQCEIDLNPSHPVYKGHFPGLPVTPGVCMLSIIKGCVSIALQRPFRYSSIRSCKFLSVVSPTEHSVLSLHFIYKDNDQLQAILSTAKQPVLKLKASLVEI